MAGEEIRFICEVVTRGTKTPFAVETMSSIAEALGVVVPIPTLLFCALLMIERHSSAAEANAMNSNFFKLKRVLKNIKRTAG